MATAVAEHGAEIARAPADPDAACAAALRLHQAGEVARAAAAYRRILAGDPGHADSLHLLGMILAEDGDPGQALHLVRAAIAHRPGQAPYHNTLAAILRRMGQPAEARAAYAAAIALRPDLAALHCNLASLLAEAGETDAALAAYRHALALAPAAGEIWYNYATILARTGTGPDAAVAEAFARACALLPGQADAQYNHGVWLVRTGQWAAAEAALATAAALRPDHAPTWCNRGIAAQEAGDAAAAEAAYRHALALDPGLAAAHYNLGCLLALHGRADEAATCQAAALAIEPLHGAARLAACMAHLPILYRTADEPAARRAAYAAALDRLAATLGAPAGDRALADAVGTAQPFFLPYQGQDDRDLQARYGAIVSGVLAASHPPAPRPRALRRGGRLRLGIVSGHFRQHTIWKLFLQGWLATIDRDRFEVIGFHTGLGADAQTAAAARACDLHQGARTAAAWRDVVLRAAPDVLLYPEVGMDAVAAQLAAQRLAPVQCVAWGHPVTTGLPTIDIFLSSVLMEPAAAQAHYTERLVGLPNLGICTTPDPVTLATDRRALGLPADVPVFWCGQALYKYLPGDDVIFPRIARRTGPCRFVFVSFAASAQVTALFRARLAACFAAEGLSAEDYCTFLPSLSPAGYVAALGCADVVLDTLGWSGGKSTLDALAQDPVIVTCPGRFMRGRHTAAILRRIGCPETIVATPDEYVDLAAALALDAARRGRLRAAVAAGKHLAFGDTLPIRAMEEVLEQAYRA